MSDVATKISVGKYDGTNGHMSFEIALDTLKRGGKVRRACWHEASSPIAFDNETREFVDIGIDVIVELSAADLLAEDWVEVF